MIEDKELNNFRKKYKNVHPLVFHRSLEKSKNSLVLFEILESVPKYPFYWNDNNKSWKTTDDFMIFQQAKNLL